MSNNTPKVARGVGGETVVIGSMFRRKKLARAVTQTETATSHLTTYPYCARQRHTIGGYCWDSLHVQSGPTTKFCESLNLEAYLCGVVAAGGDLFPHVKNRYRGGVSVFEPAAASGSRKISDLSLSLSSSVNSGSSNVS